MLVLLRFIEPWPRWIRFNRLGSCFESGSLTPRVFERFMGLIDIISSRTEENIVIFKSEAWFTFSTKHPLKLLLNGWFLFLNNAIFRGALYMSPYLYGYPWRGDYMLPDRDYWMRYFWWFFQSWNWMDVVFCIRFGWILSNFSLNIHSFSFKITIKIIMWSSNDIR